MGSWSGRPEGTILMPPRPAYARVIADDVIAKIRNGTYPPGHKLPSIREMTEAYNCSESPVKSALKELEIRGFTEGHQGVGTFVVANPPIG